MPDHPAEELREAAERLRLLAGKATPGPWTPMVLGSEGYLVLRKTGTIRERGRGRVARFGCKDWDGDKADAEYVASMSPLVALALADLLDAAATSAETLADGGMVPRAPIRAALAVARAFMGSDKEQADA